MMGEIVKAVIVPVITVIIQEGMKLADANDKRRTERQKNVIGGIVATATIAAIANYMKDKSVDYKNGQQAIALSKN